MSRAVGDGGAEPARQGLLERVLWFQRRAADVLYDYLQPERFEAAGFATQVRDLVADPAGSFRFFLPGAGASVAWTEEGNKLEIYLLVSQASLLLHMPTQTPVDLPALVARAYAEGAFRALWAIEGLGHDWTDVLWTAMPEPPNGLLTGPEAAGVPAESLLMLHAGFGLAAGRRAFRTLRDDVGGADLRRAAEEAMTLCRINSRPGYEGAALEALGLVARTFYPWCVARLGADLAFLDPAAADFFWHGVGRAVYFLPLSFLPCGNSTRRNFRTVAEEVPEGRARRNARAGLAWAVTLVNQRNPEVVADLVARDGGALASDGGFSNGVASAVIMRQATTPDAPFIADFCAYPAGGEAWRTLVAAPCRTAVDTWYPRLAAAGRLGEVFRYHASGEEAPW